MSLLDRAGEMGLCQAVVVERSRASYLIGILGMLKVEGSNPGVIYFRRLNKSNLKMRFGLELRMRDSRKRLLRMRATSIFGLEREFDFLGG